MFRFSEKELESLEKGFRTRIDAIQELTVWDDPNYAVDEQWASMYPYGLSVKPGTVHEFNVTITNHSGKRRDYEVDFRLPEGARLMSVTKATKVPTGAFTGVRALIELPSKPGHYLVRADIKSDGIDVRDWIESTVTITAEDE